jgi:hypothetical protein
MSKSDKKLGKIKPKEKPLLREVPVHGKKKPKKDKRPWADTYHTCPFCFSTLEKIDPTKDWWYFKPSKHYGLCQMVDNYAKKCDMCGAFEVPNACPSCHRDTWFKPDDTTCTKGEYKHYKHGCGFSGRLKTKEKV